MAKEKKKKRERSKSLTAKEQRNLEAEIRRDIGEGKNAVEIMEHLSIKPNTFLTYMTRIKDIDRERFNELTSVDVYTDFIEKARSNIKDLKKMRKRFDYRKQFTALVAAIKQEHEINKDVVKLGQQLGFIEQKGAEVTVESELTFSTMTTAEVRKQVNNEIEKLNNMAQVQTVMMRPELLEAVGEEPEAVKKFVPDYIGVEDAPVEKKKVKVKTKIKLKRRN